MTDSVKMDAIIRDRNRPQKHVARAQVLIATAAEHNRDPRPFTWTADRQRVLARCKPREPSVRVDPLAPEVKTTVIGNLSAFRNLRNPKGSCNF